MFDLGRTLLAAVERDPVAEAVVDGERRLSYANLFESVRRIMSSLEELGLRLGDHLVMLLQNRVEMVILHWACQMLGVVSTPVNWRVKAEELDYYLEDAEARAVVFQEASAPAVTKSVRAQGLPRIAVDDSAQATCRFWDLLEAAPADGAPRASAEDMSLMFYTSGTTGRPKGVPRRHRTERAAALAHVAQNCYAYGERTLGVMPLYHTMGVRSLLSMALTNGCFVCLGRFEAERALQLIEREKITNLYLVPTLYHDLLAHPASQSANLASVRKLGFAGAPMSEGLLRRVAQAFHPDLFVNHYGSSEVYTFTINQNAAAKPGSAGKAGINTRVRVVKLNSTDPEDLAAVGEDGHIITARESDESFEGYWKRPDADAKALHRGWYFTGDVGHFDAEGDLFVTGRVDDMIISGGENVHPGEIEDVLSLCEGVAEVVVAGVFDERLGQRITAFVKRRGKVDAAQLDAFCRASPLADFKRPREYVFVSEIPKSPTGKILRRMLVAGEFKPEK
jgi:2-furoate---CoA ligase